MSKKHVTEEREQTKRLHSAMKTELEQTTARADAVLERLRKKADSRPPLRLVKAK